MNIKGMATTPTAAAKSMNLYEDDAKVQKNSKYITVNVEKSLSPTMILTTMTTAVNKTLEKENNQSILKAIDDDLEKSEAVKDAIPETVGMLSIKSANQTIMEAKQRPDPKSLWLSLWYEGEVCCLFADSNVGKSIYAVQIAENIAKTQRVLYFDFELSDKQFQLRYTDEQGNSYLFSDNFLRGEINKESLDVTNFEDNIISNIESTAQQSGAKVLIIDNLTWICSNSEKGDVAGRFMMKLTALKKKHDFSVLIIAHTPKRSQSNPITQNDLAGSKKLYNFFDSCFSIGMSAKDGGLRYIKQMKVRHGEYEYGADNVIVCQLDRVNAFLQFVPIGYSTEREHLRERTESDLTELESTVMELHSQGRSLREIAVQLNISKSTVQRIIKKYE
jgi:DNA-binding NarL/FixJ family response regulator